MIGTIEVPVQGRMVTATLEDNGKWGCPDPALEAYLNLWWAPEDRPALGRFGIAYLVDAAKRLDGTAHFREEEDDAPAGTVY